MKALGKISRASEDAGKEELTVLKSIRARWQSFDARSFFSVEWDVSNDECIEKDEELLESFHRVSAAAHSSAPAALSIAAEAFLWEKGPCAWFSSFSCWLQSEQDSLSSTPGYRVLSRLVTDPGARTAGQDPWKADWHAWRMLLLEVSSAGESPRAGVLRKRDKPLPCETVPPGTVSPSTTHVCTARPENDRNVITSIANKGGTSMFLTQEGAATSGKGDAVRVDGAVTASRLTVRSQARLLRGIRGSSASDVQSGAPLVAARPGFPPICAAAQAGRVRMVALLLASGAHPDTAVVAGAAPSALHLAAAGGHKAVAETLVAAGASLKFCDSAGATPLQVALRRGNLRVAAVLHCGCGDGRQMAGWGPEALLAVRMAGRSVEAGEEDMLLRVFARATKIWEHAIGRPLFRVCASEEAPDHPEDSRITYTIEVDFGEWNAKNGYTAPSVRPNRWPLRRSGAKIFLRKRSAAEVAPRSVEEALVATACHELGHALGLSHHPRPGELMHFMGMPHLDRLYEETIANAGASDARLCDALFGPDCTAAGRWLYNSKLCCVTPATLRGGYPTVCIACYAPGWWSTLERGEYRRVAPADFVAHGKPRVKVNTRRVHETLSDGSMRLITTQAPSEIDHAARREDASADGNDARSLSAQPAREADAVLVASLPPTARSVLHQQNTANVEDSAVKTAAPQD